VSLAGGPRPPSGPGAGWFPWVLLGPAMVTLVVVALVPFLYTV
jgi:hypothetical protein